MLKTALLPLAATMLLAGCVTVPPDPAFQAKQAQAKASTPVCEGAADCSAKWDAAQVWVVKNAGMKIQTATNVLIETYGTTDLALAVRVLKEPAGAGKFRITAEPWCVTRFGMECSKPPLDALLDFNAYVNAAKP